ncbi:ParB/RepB/Spo0J family partition protein [Nioella sp.]|uniref:ParB/RepB/Spo0J family partition protein n=1 Tax=Nioella sp. TaxID=1912091 RepID=UPI003A85E51A
MTTETQDGLGVEARRVRLDELHLDTDTFQFRWEDLTESQVDDLMDALKRRKELDPLTVWERPEDGCLFIVDGHHRYEAYRRSGKAVTVPVTVHRCALKSARLLALEENTKTRLAMSQQERLDAAWQLECSEDGYSKAEIVKAAGVGNGTVANMRRVKRRLAEADSEIPTTWRAAQMLDAGREQDWTEEDWDARREEYVLKLKEEIAGAIAAVTRADPTIAPDAMRRIMGEDRFRQGLEWLDFYEGERDPITDVVTLKLNKEPELDMPF